jgi:ECF sigma factor
MSDVTRMLQSIEQGNSTAAEELLPLVYDELRQLVIEKERKKTLNIRNLEKEDTQHPALNLATKKRKKTLNILP